MGRLFGTDGVRGVANTELTPELALAVAAGAVQVLGGRRPTVLVGRDTRPSGPLLEAAVVAGAASAGADVVRLGVVPTPAVAFGVAERGGDVGADIGADLGVMLSASHNPMPDNGIKLFGPGGVKLPDEVEDRVEALVERSLEGRGTRPAGADVGRVLDAPAHEIVDRYVDHLLSTVPPGALRGLRVVVDCAEGAAYELSPRVLRAAGADVVAIAAAGDGLRINDGCGATATEALQKAVVAHGADAGIAHDGDADRCLAVDATGSLVDGDQLLAILALALRERGALRGDTVVATVMSNLGFRQAMAAAGLRVLETPVGDRYVLEEMRAGGYALGGEQSGHVVMLDHATTGDGLLTALQVLARMAGTGRSLADLASVMRRLPQVLVNVRADRAAANAPEVLAAVGEVERELGDRGRVLLRPSGTEPLVRVMVEAGSAETARAVAERLAAVVARVSASSG